MTQANNADRAPALLRQTQLQERLARMALPVIRIGVTRNLSAPRILLLCTMLASSTPAFAFFCFNFGFGGGGPSISTTARQLPLIDPSVHSRAPYSKQRLHRMPPRRYLRPSRIYPLPAARWQQRWYRRPPAWLR